ncbi:NAD(P)/FAD-dependent oxidoreductase [Chloroflexota bacterium]|nr:NAD(P)/FAD-dependent oxidoreductase [Chloroflexota bacterium]
MTDKRDYIIVGGGMAGLTAAAFLAKDGYQPLLIEKQDRCGGLVTTFTRDGFTYDGGIRATEDSGVLFPMLDALGLNVDFAPNRITLGIEDKIIQVTAEEDLAAYEALLIELYPESADDIRQITAQMKRIMGYMDIQYRIKNPAFLDPKEDWQYFATKVVPWMFQYAAKFKKIEALNTPVEAFLRQYTDNDALVDIIAQHFFTETPAFFALSYIKLYLDYHYPRGGTGTLIQQMVDYIGEHGGEIRLNTAIQSIDPSEKTLTDESGTVYHYEQLIWAADQKTLYREMDTSRLQDSKVRTAINDRWNAIKDKTGNDSILTIYLGVDLDKSFFSEIASEHFFYTPSRKGQSAAGPWPVTGDKETVKQWLADFLQLTTYEIAIPVLRDASLAPEGKTGLIVSVLFDYGLTKAIFDAGWYDEFAKFVEERITQALDGSIYPGLAKAIVQRFSATPLTVERYSGNADGAITGWSFTNHPMPAEHRLPKIYSASKTPIPDVWQAGQWTYSPSGLPISILTGKLAADAAVKALRKGK